MEAVFLVTAQFSLIGLLIWPTSEMLNIGPAFALALPAVALAVWTLKWNRPGNFNIRPTLKAGSQLITQGPYAWVRHPMYVCVLWCGIAAVVLYASWIKLVFLMLLCGVLWLKAVVEEKALLIRFPEYQDYANRVGRFIPAYKN